MVNERSALIEEIVQTVCNGQAISQDQLQQIRVTNAKMPDSIFISFLMSFFEESPSTTNWKVMMEGIEGLLSRNADEEQIRIVVQHILEPFADAASNKEFNPELIKPHVGPKARAHLNAYEAFHGSTYRY